VQNEGLRRISKTGKGHLGDDDDKKTKTRLTGAHSLDDSLDEDELDELLDFLDFLTIFLRLGGGLRLDLFFDPTFLTAFPGTLACALARATKIYGGDFSASKDPFARSSGSRT